VGHGDIAGQPIDDALLAQVVTADRSPTVIVDETLSIVYANEGTRILGWDPAEMIGRLALDFLHPDEVGPAMVAVSLLSGGQLIGSGVYRFRRKDGTFASLDLTSIILEGTDGATLYAISGRTNPFDDARTEAYSAIASGAPPEESLAGAAAYLSPTRPGASMAFDTTRHRFVAGPFPPSLAGVFDGRQDRSPGTPWNQALDELCVVKVTDTAALPVKVRSAADTAGFCTAAFLGTADPGRRQPALLATWTTDPALADILGLYLEDLEPVVRIALDRRATHEQLEHLAHHDMLTGLPNRARFFALLTAAMAPPLPVAVAYLDLDGFKAINDGYGHAAGDEVLVELGRRFGREMRAGDVVARLGGDEFAVVLTDQADEATAVAIVERLLAAAAQPVDVGGGAVTLAASAGLAILSDATTSTPDALVRQADAALYRAKRTGPGSLAIAPHEPRGRG
jgi:diguanylate cyclase (GGDEF)-like protein